MTNFINWGWAFIQNMTLEEASWLAQIILMVIAVVAAAIAFYQVSTFKLFELLKFLEEERFRDARRVVYKHRKSRKNWWDANDKLRAAASTVCASYDIVGHLARGGNRKFFKLYWAYSICWTHEALDGFLKARRKTVPDAYHAYSELYKEAKPFDSRNKLKAASKKSKKSN